MNNLTIGLGLTIVCIIIVAFLCARVPEKKMTERRTSDRLAES